MEFLDVVLGDDHPDYLGSLDGMMIGGNLKVVQGRIQGGR
jgi:hypothetical protein